ncbi:MAG: sugar ABC transporter permease [Clostridia bacterium]|nr:sugar ABC transporter permease [Clostridia bacterium]
MAKQRKKHYSLVRRQNRAGWMFVMPFVIGFLIFFAKPMVESFWYTLNDVTMGQNGLETKWVGLGNFRYLLLEDSSFLRNLWTVTSQMLAQVAICTILSLFIAIVLVQNFRGRTIYRAIFFLPIIMTSGVVYSMVSSVVGSSGLSGTGNAYIYSSVSMMTLMQQGGVPTAFINLITQVIDAIFSMVVNCGVPILLYISGLQKIPQSAYEAARIEGASTWDIFWRITIPKIFPIIFLNVVYCVIDASTAYGAQQGGNVMMAAIQQMGFGKTMKFGMSAAMAWMYFLVIALFLGLAWLTIGRRAAKIEN